MIRLHVDNQQVFEHIILQYFYFAIVLYVCQVRPEINEYFIDDYKVENEKKNWDYVLDRLLNSTLMNDAHVVKVIRSLRELEKVYGSKSEFYLKTAVKTVDNFNIKHRWIGISDDERQLNVVKSS
ncbi:unnamed protein product [Rotaria magnacalcarata]|nr:unnamed protein product [Rotaria magnacalcarata]